MQTELDVGGAGVKVGAHRGRLVLPGVADFFSFEVMLDVDQAGETVEHGPKVGEQAEESVDAGHGG